MDLEERAPHRPYDHLMDQMSLLDEGDDGPRRLGVTTIVELRRCPRRFAHRVVEGHGTVAPGGAGLGLAVHRAIQQGTEPSRAARPYVDAFRRSGYAERRLVAAELPIRLRRGEFTVSGRIDAIFDDDGWDLVDFKTGGPPSSPDAADDAQLELYALAAVEGYGRPADEVTTTYLYLATGETRQRKWSPTLVADAEARLAADLDHIRTGTYPARTNRTCPGCDALEVCPEGIEILSRR